MLGLSVKATSECHLFPLWATSQFLLEWGTKESWTDLKGSIFASLQERQNVLIVIGYKDIIKENTRIIYIKRCLWELYL